MQTEIEDQEDAEKIILTYKDNEALDNGIISQIEKNIKKAATSNYWKNWVRVYVDGEMGQLEGVVFSNWKQIDTIPEEASKHTQHLSLIHISEPTRPY